MFKAFIESIENNGYLYRVRIPVYHKIQNTPGATPFESLPLAPVCTIPGVKPFYQLGDVVWVDFENNEIGNPVIIGLLYREQQTEATIDINCNNLITTSEARLPSNTTVGETSKSLDTLPQLLKYTDETNNCLDILMRQFDKEIEDQFAFDINTVGNLILTQQNPDGQLAQKIEFTVDTDGHLIATVTDLSDAYTLAINDNGNLMLSVEI